MVMLLAAGCDGGRGGSTDTDSASDTGTAEGEEREESALQEYVNEPKRRAADAKCTIERSQADAAALAESAAAE